MGRKALNPADEARRAERKKEKKKNKAARMEVRKSALDARDPKDLLRQVYGLIDAEKRAVEEDRSVWALQDKRRKLKEQLDQVLDHISKEADGEERVKEFYAWQATFQVARRAAEVYVYDPDNPRPGGPPPPPPRPPRGAVPPTGAYAPGPTAGGIRLPSRDPPKPEPPMPSSGASAGAASKDGIAAEDIPLPPGAEEDIPLPPGAPPPPAEGKPPGPPMVCPWMHRVDVALQPCGVYSCLGNLRVCNRWSPFPLH